MKLNALDAMLSMVWAMEEGALDQMRAICAREKDAEAWKRGLPESVAAQLGTRLRDTERVEVRDGVAVIPITGPIFRRANLFTEMSGATSVELLARDFNAALSSDSARAILLNIDSPGGQANGIGELSNMVYAARKKKPICAYVGGTACSAAYWIASAAETIVADPSALLGSIGTVIAFQRGDGSEIKYRSSQSPKKQADPESELGQAEYQQIVDEMTQVFVSDTARNRGVTEQKVLRDFGQGGVLVGKAAMKAGMVDRMGSFEGTLARLAASVAPKTGGARADDGNVVPEEFAEALINGPKWVVLTETNAGETITTWDGDVPTAVAVTPGIDDLTISAEVAPLAGATFADHSLSVLAAVESLADRAERYAALRAEEGRSVNLQRREEWTSLRDRLTALLDATQPKAGAAVRLRLAAVRARLAGMEQAHEPVRCSSRAETDGTPGDPIAGSVGN